MSNQYVFRFEGKKEMSITGRIEHVRSHEEKGSFEHLGEAKMWIKYNYEGIKNLEIWENEDQVPCKLVATGFFNSTHTKNNNI